MKQEVILRAPDFTGLARELLKRGASIRFRVKGWSMHPFIRDGDVITSAPVLRGSLRRGDIVLCALEDSRIVVHRYRKKSLQKPDAAVVSADSYAGTRETFNERDILFRVVAIEREGAAKDLRRYSSFLGRNFSALLSLLLGRMSYAGRKLRRFWQRLKKI